MTEEQWFAAERLWKLLHCVHRKCELSQRKGRLFGVVCCRRVLEQIPDVTLTEVIDGCERLADEMREDLDVKRLDRLARSARACYETTSAESSDEEHEYRDFAFAVLQLTGYTLSPSDCAESCRQALGGHDDFAPQRGEELFQIDLLRDLVGNPFRPVAFAPEWSTDTAVAISREMYDTRDFSAMPILADALQDAGCDAADILSHCRDTAQTHVRGCWVVDLVLGKG
jgi:hypothetical protein